MFFSLWNLIQCVLHWFGYVPFLVLALLASPSTVIFTLLLYITSALCVVHVLAACFILCKAVKREQGACCRMFQIVWYVLLCVAFLCFITLISAAGAVANYGSTAWNSNPSVFSLRLSTVAPVTIMWSLRRISMLWLQTLHGYPSQKDEYVQMPKDEPEINLSSKVNESSPLLRT